MFILSCHCVTVSAWKIPVWRAFPTRLHSPQTLSFSLFRNRKTEVQTSAKYCLHSMNLLITSHILLIQCQSKAILLLTYLRLNCSFKHTHKCFFGWTPGLLGTLPCQAPGEYIFLTWAIFSGSDLHLSAHWQLNVSGHRWEGAPCAEHPGLLLMLSTVMGRTDISGFRGQLDMRIYPLGDTTGYVTAKYLTCEKENVFKHLEEEVKHEDTKMKKLFQNACWWKL